MIFLRINCPNSHSAADWSPPVGCCCLHPPLHDVVCVCRTVRTTLTVLSVWHVDVATTRTLSLKCVISAHVRCPSTPTSQCWHLVTSSSSRMLQFCDSVCAELAKLHWHHCKNLQILSRNVALSSALAAATASANAAKHFWVKVIQETHQEMR